MTRDTPKITERGATNLSTAALATCDAIDQHVDELRTVWLALGNATDLPETDQYEWLRNALNSIVLRIEETGGRLDAARKGTPS